MCDTVFARLDKVGLASHRCNGNFGEGCIQAALAYAANVLAHETIVLPTAQ